MTRALVCGNATATMAHPSLRGQKILLVQTLDASGKPTGVPALAVDPLGAGLGSEVLVTTDGRGAQQLLDDPDSPVRNSLLAIVDFVDSKDTNSEARKTSSKQPSSSKQSLTKESKA